MKNLQSLLLLTVLITGCRDPQPAPSPTPKSVESVEEADAPPLKAIPPVKHQWHRIKRPKKRAALALESVGPEAVTDLWNHDGAYPADTPLLDIKFVDVGQGDCTLVTFPNGKRLLVDCGVMGPPKPDPAQVRADLLGMIPNKKIDWLLLTHADTDHYAMIPHVLAGFRISTVLHTHPIEWHTANAHVPWTETTKSSAFAAWLLGYSAAGKLVRLKHGAADEDHDQESSHHFPGIDPAKVFVLATSMNNNNKDKKNDSSTVLKITLGQVDVLLTGDATEVVEKFIVGKYPNAWLDVELLKLGHHGSSSTSNKEDWLKVVKPELAVASAGHRNKHKHPNRKFRGWLERWTWDDMPAHRFQWRKSASQQANSYVPLIPNYTEGIYSTAQSGHVLFETDGNTLLLSTTKP